MTGAEALSAAIRRFSAAGIEGGARDARLLLAHAMGIGADRLTLHLADALTPAMVTAFSTALDAREARQPVSQIIGQRQFWGRSFRVTPAVLDPRPETETLIAATLAEPFRRVLDLGTGSGAILLTLLAERPEASGIGCDLSVAALAVAQQNLVAFGLEDRATLLVSDWFSAIDGQFDLIVSNPPYISEAEMAGLAPEVLLWEPKMALTPGGDGLAAYRALSAGLRDHLAPGGRVFLEIGPAQARAVSGFLVGAGLASVRVLCDMDGRDRVVTGVAG
jgi:release factor glutamine methyltransferase